jgi:hypothetical protein
MNLFEDIKRKKNLISLDIETSGTDPLNDQIWAIGSTDQKGNAREIFYSPDGNVEDFKTKLTSIKGFSEKQIEHGVFDEYFDGLKTDRWNGQSSIAGDVSSLMDKNNAILIQNAIFENKFLSRQLLNNDNVGVPFRDNFMFRGGDTSDYFYVPPEVQNNRAHAAKAFDLFLDGNNDSFNNVVYRYQKMMQAYSDAASNKGIMVIDLMHVSKATYAMAAQKGLIDKKFIGIGLGVEFLAKHILNEPEKHGALSDAIQQNKIFERMSKMYEEINSGNISDDTKNIFARINAAHPRERLHQMARGISRAMEEAIQPQGYKKMDSKDIKTLAAVYGPNGRENVEVYTSPIDRSNRDLLITRNPKEAAFHVISRYQRLGVDNKTISRAKILIESGKDINHLLDDEGIYENIEAISRTAKDKILSMKEKSFNWFNNLSTQHKAVAIGTAILGVGFALSDSEDSEERIKEINKKKEQVRSKMYTDSTLKMYTNIPHHHGSGFADWNERTKHHEY